MPGNAKAIFFDLGETLVTQNIEDSMVTRSALQEISKILPQPTPPNEMFRLYQKGYRANDAIRSEYNVEIPIQVWMRTLLDRIIGRTPSDQLVNKSVNIIVKKRALNALAFDDAKPTLKTLSQKRRVKLGIISNVSSHDVALGILEKVGLDGYFDQVITSAQTGIRKPDPGIFRYALHRFGVAQKAAVIVGDSERHDIRGGFIVGLQTVLVNRKGSADDSVADHVFKSLAEAAPTLESL